MLTKNGHFWTTYLPRLVNVVCERPLIFSFKVARRCLSFLHNGLQELSILDINCPQGSVACWVLLSALEVLQTCRDFSQNSTSTQVQQYCFYTAELWSYCREKMLLLGKLIVFVNNIVKWIAQRIKLLFKEFFIGFFF